MSRELRRRLKSMLGKKGFTLLEVLIVIVIIGVMSGLAIPRFMKATVKAKQTEAKQLLKHIFVMQESYKLENDDYWIPPEGLEANALNPEAFAELGVEIMASARYSYSIQKTDNGFVAKAKAIKNLDSDPTVDEWQIDDNGELKVVMNDVSR